MDLMFYVTYHYFDIKPKWMEEALGSTPKNLDDILLDLTVKLFILFPIIYLVRRVLLSFYNMHDGRRRRLQRLERIYKELLQSERQKEENARRRNERIEPNNEHSEPLRQEE